MLEIYVEIDDFLMNLYTYSPSEDCLELMSKQLFDMEMISGSRTTPNLDGQGLFRRGYHTSAKGPGSTARRTAIILLRLLQQGIALPRGHGGGSLPGRRRGDRICWQPETSLVPHTCTKER